MTAFKIGIDDVFKFQYDNTLSFCVFRKKRNE